MIPAPFTCTKKGSRGDAPCAGGGARSPSWVWAKPKRNISAFPGSKNRETAVSSMQMSMTCMHMLYAES